MVFVLAALALSALVLPTLAATSWIVPGAVWLDTSGNKIDAHGGMIIKPGSVWYWIGYSINAGVSPIIYSSEDLLNWDNRGLANSIQQMWRPKLIVAGGRFNVRSSSKLDSSLGCGSRFVSRVVVIRSLARSTA